MEAYERLQPPGSMDSNVELSHVVGSTDWVGHGSGSIWFPDEVPPVELVESSGPAWLPEDEDEFFWQELTEEEISERHGLTKKTRSLKNLWEKCGHFM